MKPLSFDVDGRTLNLRYADCEQAEDAGGLIYVWPRNGAPDRGANSSYWLTPRRRRASFPTSRLGSGMGGEPLSWVNRGYYCGDTADDVESGASA